MEVLVISRATVLILALFTPTLPLPNAGGKNTRIKQTNIPNFKWYKRKRDTSIFLHYLPPSFHCQTQGIKHSKIPNFKWYVTKRNIIVVPISETHIRYKYKNAKPPQFQRQYLSNSLMHGADDTQEENRDRHIYCFNKQQEMCVCMTSGMHFCIWTLCPLLDLHNIGQLVCPPPAAYVQGSPEFKIEKR